MTHEELVYNQLYINAIHITVSDTHLGTYKYLCKHDDDANELLTHLMDKFGKYAIIEITRLCNELN